MAVESRKLNRSVLGATVVAFALHNMFPQTAGAEEPPREGQTVPELTELPWESGALDAAALAALRERLREKEEERRALRREERARETAAGGRAW